jgi:putative transposase
MRILGVRGVRRGKKIRTTIPAKDGRRAADLLDRDFTAPAPNRVWVADFSHVRTWLGFVYVAFIVDVFAQRIVAWHAATSKITELVMIPLRMALWQRSYQGHPAELGQLIHHSDAGSQYTLIRFTDHLDVEQIAPPSARSATPTTVRLSSAGRRPDSCLRLTPRFGCLGC